MPGKLSIIPTPIGNLSDITLRALQVIQEVDLLLTEDTRTTGNLLKHHGLEAKMAAFHQHNEHKALFGMVENLKSGMHLGMISDAGTPGISDPGFLLLREAVNEGIEIDCLPGATALIPALIMSGFPCDKFYFEGFLPHKKGRQTRWQFLGEMTCSIVLYESPHRLKKMLEEALEHMPERDICVSREISKIHQENVRGKAEELLLHFEKKPPKGEIVVCISAIKK